MPHRGEAGRRRARALLILVVLIASAVPVAPARASEATIERTYGADRYATAAAVSEDFAPGLPAVFVATGQNFPDSLAGGPAAARLGAPILLATASRLPDATRSALSRLQPRSIVVLGGPGVVSDAVAAALGTYAPTSRLFGPTRYETAVAISRTFPAGVPVAYVATGRTFPDALAAGAAAAAQGGPLLLVDTASIPDAVRAELARLQPQRIVVAGGAAVVSDGVLAQLNAMAPGGATRLWGADRFGTAAAISRAAFASAPSAHIATGLGFADAVAAVPAAARTRGPLLLSTTAGLPSATTAEIARLRPNHTVVLGGPTVLSKAVIDQAVAASGLTLIGPHAFRWDAFSLETVPDAYLAYNGDTIVAPYGQLENGVYKWNYNGTWVDHPVGQAQYVVNMLRNYRLDPKQEYLDLAIANASRLLERAVRHEGAVFFPYGFDFYLHGRGTMRAPWYSGMAQGIALSGFVRLYQITHDRRWLQAANETYASFLVGRDSGGPWVTSTDNGLLWFELYPWTPNDHTYNGHNWAIYGLYDYWRLTGSSQAQQLIMAGLTTSKRALSIVRVPGGVMRYCIAQSCLDRNVVNSDYHLVVTNQMIQLFRYTRDEDFARMADAFVTDTPYFKDSGTVVLMPGTHVGASFDSAGMESAAANTVITEPTEVAYAQRNVPYGWVRPGNGVRMYLTEGPLAGTWVRETPMAFVRGFVDRYDFYWGRNFAVPAGDVTGYRFNDDGTIAETLTAPSSSSAWRYSSSARINGQRAGLVVDGPLAGYWVALDGPWTAEATSVTAAAATAQGGASASGMDTQRSAATPSVAPPPLPPSDPLIPPPEPGQLDAP
ncbi:MAG TPA: cell wall-binding repeat-containing protein [Candidatus Limnocylindria bacterium]|nr:cell wall-binding repeat-containing protein [Candidatus Limnocylindria bacterium]